MDIIKAGKDNLIDIVFLFRETVRDMNKNGFYHWNTGYPNPEIIKTDIEEGSLFMVMENFACIGVIVMNEQSSPEFNTVEWKGNGTKVLYIHRLAVHPVWKGKGITEKMLGFAEKYGRENNFSSIRLDVFDTNDHRIGIVKNRKFEEMGKIHLSYQKTPFTCYEKEIK